MCVCVCSFNIIMDCNKTPCVAHHSSTSFLGCTCFVSPLVSAHILFPLLGSRAHFLCHKCFRESPVLSVQELPFQRLVRKANALSTNLLELSPAVAATKSSIPAGQEVYTACQFYEEGKVGVSRVCG